MAKTLIAFFSRADENYFNGAMRYVKGEKIIVAEDVVTKGGRVQQTIDLVRSLGGIPVGVGIVTDRSGGKVDFGIPLFSLIKLDLPTFDPAECPLCKEGKPLTRPGSGAKS